MKTIIFKQRKNSKILLQRVFLIGFSVVTHLVYAQMQNNDHMYISDFGHVYIASNNYYFGSGNVQTKTSRTLSNYGELIFSSNASSSGASDAHFLDGYGSVISTGPFLFPIGSSGIYAPARVIPSTTAQIDAAYFSSSALSIGSVLDSSVSAVSASEYWNIKGNNSAVISLTWRSSSNLTGFVAALYNVTIVGYNGTNWVEIPSTFDSTSILGGASSLTAGSITSTGAVDLSVYSYFTIGAKGDSCASLIASSGNTVTWTGSSWSPSAPTLADPVIISSNYSGGSFACNSLVLNANISLSDGQNVEIVNGVTGTGKIIMSSEASVVQRASGVGAPNIELTKKTRDVMHRYDYIYWGTPIAGNFFSQLAGAKASTASVANAFDVKYKYVTGSGGGWQTLTANETGKGYIMRIKSQAPFTNATNTDYINLKFTGVANNGNVTIPITNDPNFPNGGTSYPLLANPYPSAIDADKLLIDNSDIDGVVYLWTSSTVNNGTGQTYTQADYIAYTLAGTVVPNNISNSFTGKIASGQGFRVRALNASGNVTFTNCMRVTGNNNQFLKSLNTVSAIDRFKLNLIGDDAVFSQILIAYMPQATLNYDRLYDANRSSVSTAQLYSILDADGSKLAINARPDFFQTDVVPLGLSKSDSSLQNFTIGITEKEGVFNSNTVIVYLHDKLLETYYNLAEGDYTFSTNSTSLNDRFEIVYQNQSLSVSQFNTYNIVANLNNNAITLKSSVNMENVEIFDMMGRKVFEAKIENAKEFTSPFYNAQAVYFAKIKLEDGSVASYKLINERN